MALPCSYTAPSLPFPIFRPSIEIDQYMLYDVNVITWLRRTHHILGVLTGTLPQIPQQNVFLGLPMQLMAEEARLLTEKGLAFIVLDQGKHKQELLSLPIERLDLYTKALEEKGREAASATERRKVEARRRVLSKTGSPTLSQEALKTGITDDGDGSQDGELDEVLPKYQATTRGNPAHEDHQAAAEPWTVTPTTTHRLITEPPRDMNGPTPTVRRSSYLLFKILHAKGYYMSPGLRFGCQYMVYPGDPLRFHSHFLAIGAGWDEKLDILDLVGGGRLGTGVKKGFLLGGPWSKQSDCDEQTAESRTRVFCIEWGGL